MYPPPCTNDEDPACSCHDAASDWLNDYTWICNFRSSMTSAIRSSNPFYSLIFTTPVSEAYRGTLVNILPKCLNSRLACHCFETFHFFGMGLNRDRIKDKLTKEEVEHIKHIQNIGGNFIRNGDPNNWMNNPNDVLTLPYVAPWQDSQMFNIFGMDGKHQEAYRSDFCDGLDEMDEYMMH